MHSIQIAISQYVLALILTFVLALIVDALAPSFGGTNVPVSPSATTSATPPDRVATTGMPRIIASAATNPNDSKPTDGTT